MAFYHGITTRQVDTSISTPVVANSGVIFAVGTAPIHTVEGVTNEVILCNTYKEAISKLGYSDDWKNYTLCEVIYSHFNLYGVSPIILVNVLDSNKHKEEIAVKEFNIVEGRVLLPLEALKESVVVSDFTNETDYTLFYNNKNLVLEILDGGKIGKEITALSVSFTAVKPSLVTNDDIIGGINVRTKKIEGLELIHNVFAKYGIVADTIIAPGFSHNSEVAAVMATKCIKMNGIFNGNAIIDVDTAVCTDYTDVPKWKKNNNIFSKEQILCFPKVKLGDKIYHLSTQIAGLMAKVDSENGCPSESPSNKKLKIDSTVLANKEEITLELQQANYLNSQGIVTALNFMGGFVLWGNSTACFPIDTDVKNYFTSISRMFNWIANTVTLSYWSKLDKKMNRRLIDSITDSINIWLNGLVADEHLLGGRIEFLEEENNIVDLMSGKATFHIFLTPASPAEVIDFILEYDVNYVKEAFTK